MGILRLGHAKVRVMSMNDAVHHYTEVLGMKITGTEPNGDVLLKCWDEWDKYCLILTESDRAGIEHIAWKVEKAVDLEELAGRVERAGREVSKDGGLPACGDSIRFEIPSGHIFYLYHEKEVLGREVGNLNPDPWPDNVPGVGVNWLDHLQLACRLDPEAGVNHVADNVAFLRDVLDFGLAEQLVVGPDNETLIAAWMFRTSTPHDIAFGDCDRFGLHHLAFYMPDWSDLLRSADILAKKGVPLEVTPQRHGITRGATCYFFDPSGNRNEVFAGLGYLSQPDMPTITWTEKHLGQGIFYHSGVVPPEFVKVIT